jgi:general secretion pathway protein K
MPSLGRQSQTLRGHMKRHLVKSDMRGIALILVLWLTVLLTVIAGGFAYGMRNEALAARNTLSLAQARALADGAVHRTAFELMRPKANSEVWLPDGTVHVWDEAGAHIAASAIDESGKIDLNQAQGGLLRGLLQTAGGLDSDAAARMLDVIADWTDADDLRRTYGAEAPEYQAAGLQYRPANAPFESVMELQRVLGMTPALYAKLADSLTVHSRVAGVNPLYASRTVLLSIPGATADMVDTYIAQRQAALAGKLQPPPFPLTGGVASAVNVWRIHTEVTMSDGVSFVREAVLRPGMDVKRLLVVLEWQEGARVLASSDVRQDQGK